MHDTGLLSINGIPGSGKTLLSVLLAKKHYRSENAFYKYYIALFKYKVLKFIDNFKFIKACIKLVKKILNCKLLNNKIVKFVVKCIDLFIKFFLLLCLFVGFDIKIKIAIIFYLFFFKRCIKSFNSLDYNYYKIFPYKKINNVYSSFPILLDKKLNIWSNKISLFDFNCDYSFYPNSLMIIDEVQLFVDSDEYGDKVKKKLISRIAKFLQSHRHFGIKQILYISQSPSRIFKKARNITIGYLKLFKIINLPLGISIMRGIIYYDFEYYGRYIPRDKDERKKLPFEYKRVTKFYLRNSLFNSYDSRYLSKYNYDKPLLNRGLWNDYKVDYDYLRVMFEEND